MEAGTLSSALSIHAPTTTSLHKRGQISHLRNSNILSFPLNPIQSRSNIPNFSSLQRNIVSPISSSSSSTTVSTDLVVESPTEVEVSEDYEHVEEGRFDWYAQRYPIMPVCDLDKRVPHAKRVMGLDVVVWWDRNENAWHVFDDMCPHRLAPLSEGRIDQWGRLQCVYHGWCFNGSGDRKFIPQVPLDGPPSGLVVFCIFIMQVHTSKKACVSVYPSTLQNDMVWFWPNTDPQYRDILSKKQPPYIPELDDPSYTRLMGNRDISFGYEGLIENLMDRTFSCSIRPL